MTNNTVYAFIKAIVRIYQCNQSNCKHIYGYTRNKTIILGKNSILPVTYVLLKDSRKPLY